MNVKKMAANYCYILYNDENLATYNGYTNNLERRLRQHNGVIKGGARATTRLGCEWKYLCYLSSADVRFDKRMALSLEWWIKHPTGHKKRPKEFCGKQGRILGLKMALSHDKFKDLQFIVYCNSSCDFSILEDLSNCITLKEEPSC